MSHPPPPGHSLPARPPPSSSTSSGPKPPFQPAFNAPRNAPSSSFGGFAPRSLAAPSAPPPQNYNNYPQQQAYAPQQPSYNNNGYAPPQSSEPAYGAAPQIRNPFAPPSAAGSAAAARAAYDEDPEYALQVAQWQSAYSSAPTTGSGSGGYTGVVRKPNYSSETSGNATSANAAPLGGNMTSAAMSSAAHASTGIASIVSDSSTNTKTVVRSGGGTTWTDSSLLEWDPAHFRLFVGNLAGEVTDESLQKAFSKWTSVQKARVIRDKRTTKSKGYGFVSFSDGDDFFQAARDMQGKYIGSHPILLRKSTTEIKAVNPRDKRNNKGKGGKNGKGNSKEDKTGAGVQKAGSKTKGGLRVLG